MWVIDQLQKHSETALDTPKKEGAESSFPLKMHLIPGKTPAIYKISVVQMWSKIQTKSQIPENQRLAIYEAP